MPLDLSKCPLHSFSGKGFCYIAMHFVIKNPQQPCMFWSCQLLPYLAVLFQCWESEQSIPFPLIIPFEFYILSAKSHSPLRYSLFKAFLDCYCRYAPASFWQVSVIVCANLCYVRSALASLNNVLNEFCVIDCYLQFAGPKTYSLGSTTDSSTAANLDKSVLKASIFFT